MVDDVVVLAEIACLLTSWLAQDTHHVHDEEADVGVVKIEVLHRHVRHVCRKVVEDADPAADWDVVDEDCACHDVERLLQRREVLAHVGQTCGARRVARAFPAVLAVVGGAGLLVWRCRLGIAPKVLILFVDGRETPGRVSIVTP